jgi:hypothetical protein
MVEWWDSCCYPTAIGVVVFDAVLEAVLVVELNRKICALENM